ncbi:MAG TPA: hypothetical protein VGM47_00490 [Gammaproteobacteria bacterium]|jgi:hypothetical protein
MNDVSILRLYLLRALYLLLVLGLGSVIWPGILHHSLDVPLMNGVVRSLLGALGLLSLFGLRYPLQMLPLLLFEMTWKIIWFLSFALPLYSAGKMDDDTLSTVYQCLLIVIFPFMIPWGYVWANYIKKPGDRWRRA